MFANRFITQRHATLRTSLGELTAQATWSCFRVVSSSPIVVIPPSIKFISPREEIAKVNFLIWVGVRPVPWWWGQGTARCHLVAAENGFLTDFFFPLNCWGWSKTGPSSQLQVQTQGCLAFCIPPPPPQLQTARKTCLFFKSLQSVLNSWHGIREERGQKSADISAAAAAILISVI